MPSSSGPENIAGNNVSSRLKTLGFGEPPLPLKLYDYNLDTGGRVKRDRVWYYASWRDWNYWDRIVGFPLDHQPGATLRLYG